MPLQQSKLDVPYECPLNGKGCVMKCQSSVFLHTGGAPCHLVGAPFIYFFRTCITNSLSVPVAIPNPYFYVNVNL